MMHRTLRWWGFIFVGLLLCARPAHSHRPRLVEGNASPARAYVIDDPGTSWAFYADLETGGRVEYYRFRLPAAQEVAPELLVPDERVFDRFHPAFVLYGEGVSAAPGAVTAGALPAFEIPLQAAAVTAASVDEHLFENFTRKAYRRTAKTTLALPAGEYGVAIYSPDGRTGEYVFVIGDAEKFSLDDVPPMVNGCGRIFF